MPFTPQQFKAFMANWDDETRTLLTERMDNTLLTERMDKGWGGHLEHFSDAEAALLRALL